MDEKQQEIHKKGFDMFSAMPRYDENSVRGAELAEFNKVKVGVKNLDDATLDLGSIKKSKSNKTWYDKGKIIKALVDKDLVSLREISNFFYQVNGIYERVCNYFAFLYRYDWYTVPEIYDDKIKEEKVLGDFKKNLNFLDNSYIKKQCGQIALEVIKNGAYYGYIVPNADGLIIQQLPNYYCRVRYYSNNIPALEFNMKYFDTISDINYRLKVLNMFPAEFKKGYVAYLNNKLTPDYQGDQSSWYLLDPESCIKFNFNNSDVPMFVNAIPAIIDLDMAQDLDRKKQMQNLLKVLVQKLPMDKNGELIFDIDEAKDIHNNMVEMLSRAVGVDIVTTFADVDSIDLSDKNTTTTKDDLAKVERSVFNALGISQNLFNTDGNLSLEKSILNDESSVRDLLLQFSAFFDRVSQKLSNNSKKYKFRFYMLETTQYNYKELAKLYKEQTQMGYSKMLPQIALGHSQSFILNSVHFENEILHLSEVMIPPLMSSTLSSADLQTLGKTNKTNVSGNENNTEGQAGRPAKAEGEQSEKTIANKESMS